MGFLINKIILFSSIIILAGCARSVIKYTAKTDEQPYQMFGKITSRDFYVPADLSDSLILKWESEMYGSFPGSSVSIYEDLVFINDLSGRIFCYNIETGKQIGKLKYSSGAVYSTPIPFRNVVVFPVSQEKDNYTELVFYNYQDGKEAELIEIPGRVLTNLLTIDDDILFTTEEGAAFRYNNLGKKIWETQTYVSTLCNPALSSNLFVFGNINGEIIALNSETGDSVYVKKISGIFSGGFTIKDSIAYCGNENGFLYAIRLKDGELIWQFDTGARILMTPAADNNNVFIGNLGGWFFSIGKDSGKENWKTRFNGLLNSTPLVSNNIVVLPDVFFAFHLINKNDGTLLKTIKLEGRARLSPVYFRNLLFIGFDDGILRAYEFVD